MEAAIKMKRNSKWLVRIEKKHKLIEAHVEFVNLRRGQREYFLFEQKIERVVDLDEFLVESIDGDEFEHDLEEAAQSQGARADVRFVDVDAEQLAKARHVDELSKIEVKLVYRSVGRSCCDHVVEKYKQQTLQVEQFLNVVGDEEFVAKQVAERCVDERHAVDEKLMNQVDVQILATGRYVVGACRLLKHFIEMIVYLAHETLDRVYFRHRWVIFRPVTTESTVHFRHTFQNNNIFSIIFQ